MTTDDHATLLAAALASLCHLPMSQQSEAEAKLRELGAIVEGVMEPRRAEKKEYRRKEG